MKWSEKWSEVKWSEVKWSEVKWSEVKMKEQKQNKTNNSMIPMSLESVCRDIMQAGHFAYVHKCNNNAITKGKCKFHYDNRYSNYFLCLTPLACHTRRLSGPLRVAELRWPTMADKFDACAHDSKYYSTDDSSVAQIESSLFISLSTLTAWTYHCA